MTAGDEARTPAGWVPAEPSSGPRPPRPPLPPESSAGSSSELSAESSSESSSGPDPGGEPDGPPVVEEQETQPLTRASIRAAQEQRLAAEAEARRLASLAEESAVPRGVRALAVVSTVALAVLIGLSALVGAVSTAFAVGFAGVVLVWGWVRLTDAPSPRTAGLVLGAGSVAICAAAGLTRTDPYLVWVPVAVAISVVAALLHQVLRSGGRPRLTEGAASSVGALALVASGATYIPLPYYPHGGPWVLVAVLAVAGAALPALLLGHRLAPVWVLLGSVVLGVAVAVLVAAVFVTGVPVGWAAVAGLLVAAIAHPVMRLLFALPGATSAQSAAAVGAAPVLTVGVLVYLLARILAG